MELNALMSKQPNILWITSDQQHWNTLGLLNPEVKTPNLDNLARQGTMFTRAYCPNPTCSPTRASMITGKYPSQHGCWSLGTKLPETETTVGELLSGAGYETALIGKAHFQPLRSTAEHSSLEAYPILQDLKFWRDFHSPFYGFDHVELARNHADEAHVGQHYALWMEAKGFTQWREHFRKPTGTAGRQAGRWGIPEEFHYNTWIAERTNAMLDKYEQGHKPFFLWASFFDPHPPYLVPEPWDTMYDPESVTVPTGRAGEHDANPPHFGLTQQKEPDFSRWDEGGHKIHGFHSHIRNPDVMKRNTAIYYGMISLLDKYIGDILDHLEARGLAENTIVVFTSDHGHFYGQHGLVAKGPFHYEDVLRVPFIVRWPGRIAAGQRSDALISLVDMAPTSLAIAGADVPGAMTGVDQSDVWLGRRECGRDHLVVENRATPTTMHVKTYIDNRYKLTVYYNSPHGELFDLQTDPSEFNNLWDDPAAKDLKHELTMKLLFAEMGKEPMWMPRIAIA